VKGCVTQASAQSRKTQRAGVIKMLPGLKIDVPQRFREAEILKD